jgi:hypothetical protein
MRLNVVVVAILFASSCVLEVSLDRKACDPPNHECEDGFVCFEGTCFAEGEVPEPPPDAGAPEEDAGAPGDDGGAPPPPPDGGPAPEDAGPGVDAGAPIGPAPPGNVSAAVLSPYAVKIAWTDGPDVEDTWVIERAIESGPFVELVRLDVARLEFIDATVIGGTGYSYRMRAEAAGLAGPPSPESAVTVGAARARDGLLALYTFRNTADATVFDRSGVSPAMDLTISDLAQVTQADGELTFTGDNVIAEAADSSKLFNARASNAYTIEAWLRSADLAQTGPARVITYSSNSSERNWTLGQEGDSLHFRAKSLFSEDNESDEFGSTFNADLIHVVATYDAGAIRVFRDGAELFDATPDVFGGGLDEWHSDQRFALANEVSRFRQWKGAFHLVAVYDRALSNAEVLQHFLVGAPVAETDGDGVPDDEDNCVDVDNADQANADGDNAGDACDADDDNDGIDDPIDNCPAVANPDQANVDGDAEGDVCDPCVTSIDNDVDGDGLCGPDDNCDFDPNDDQADLDGDGIGDACDTDRDGDGLPDINDRCPDDGGGDQTDSDFDGFGDDCDLCPGDFSLTNFDSDGDGFGDACDACPHIDDDQADADGDDVGDACDPRPGLQDEILFFDGFDADDFGVGWTPLGGVWRQEGGQARQLAPSGSSILGTALLRRDDLTFDDAWVETSFTFDEPLLGDEKAGVGYRIQGFSGWVSTLGRTLGTAVYELRGFDADVPEMFFTGLTPVPGAKRRIYGGAVGNIAFSGVDGDTPFGAIAAGLPSGGFGLFAEFTPASFDHIIVFGLDDVPPLSTDDDEGNLFFPGTIDFPTAAPKVLSFEGPGDRDCFEFTIPALTGAIAEITGGPANCSAQRSTFMTVHNAGVTDLFDFVVFDGERGDDPCSLAVAIAPAGDYVVCAAPDGDLAFGGAELALSERPILNGGDNCLDAIALDPAGGSVVGAFAGIDDLDDYDCTNDDDGLEAVYTLTLPDGATLDATVETARGDETLTIIDGCELPITCFDRADDSGDLAETVSHTNNTGADQTVFLVVDEFDRVSGDAFLLDWSVTP